MEHRDQEMSAVRVEEDWEAFLAKHDMDWVVRPLSWEAGAFIGNGLIGAMVYGEEHSSQRGLLRFVLGRTDVTSTTGGSMSFDPRVPAGELHLMLEGWIYQPTNMRLDLWNAELRADITTTKGEVRLRAFIHSEKPVLCIELEMSEGERKTAVKWVPHSELAEVLKYTDGINVNQYKPDTTVERLQLGDTAVGLQHFGGGRGCVTAWKVQSFSEAHKIAWFSLVNGCEESDCSQALQEVHAAAACSLGDWVSKHRDWWHRYYEQSFLSIPDAQLESFYWIQMYKLASAVRADSPLLDNTGPWLTTTPWPGAWFNMNVQMSYSPVYTANRLELGESLIGALKRNEETLIANVPEEYRFDSAGLGRSSGLDMSSEVGDEIGNLTWVCHSIWRHYRYSMDESLLRDMLFPLLKRSVNYYLHLLTEDEDGMLHLPPTISPEYGSFKRLTVADCHYDLALLRWGCMTLLAACERLQIEDSMAERWSDILDRLAPLPIDDTGFQVGKDTPMAFGHRHFSHMLAVFPLHIVSGETEEEWALINKSLRHWLSLEGDLRGFSFTGAASIAATLGLGDTALQCLRTLLHMITPNTMYKEAGPVIETPLAGAEALQDMLLQSWGDRIRVFPAVPEEWQDAAFHQLRAEGGFLISAVRKEGMTSFIRVKSLAGEPCLIQSDLPKQGVVRAVRAVNGTVVGDAYEVDCEDSKLIRLQMHAGEEIILYSGDQMPLLTIDAVKHSKPIYNYFGGRTPWRQYGIVF